MTQNVNMLKVTDAGFPEILRSIPSPPEQIYWYGQPFEEWVDRPKVAIVGSRKMSEYGRQVTCGLAGTLAAAGVVIISGLALGTDVTAHKAALAAGGTTVAVIATGLDYITPRSNFYVARQIIQTGTIISERPPGQAIHLGLFVSRNRIISGLADIVLIPEAGLKSGSLHTARFALEQGKTVMAVPGNINNPGSEGCNNLIKSGAIPVTSADDIFFALNMPLEKARLKKAFRGTPDESRIIEILREGSLDQENLAMAAGLDGATLASTLTALELGGHIRPAGAGNWTLA
ncbi:MAG TPA: DNA-processing protein DprA [Candidatus Saccharimonadales bacterium]|nr:DNA-processing protein DprA [Candidatus Saccharimonadales bacterium]